MCMCGCGCVYGGENQRFGSFPHLSGSGWVLLEFKANVNIEDKVSVY